MELGEQGLCIDSYRIELGNNGLEKLKRRLDRDSRIVLEAGGNAFFVASRLRPYVRDVTVVHPAKTRSIAASKIKTDKHSAETLARLLASGYVTPVWIPDEDTQSARSLISHRSGLVKVRTVYKNRVHAILYRGGLIYSEGSLFSKSGRSFLENSFSSLEELDRAIVLSLLKLIDTVSDEIKLIEGHLAYLFKDSEEIRLLLTIPGIHFLMAVGIIAEIGDIGRFRTPEQLSSYAGLISRVHQTGKSMRRGGITYAGRSNLRTFLFTAVLTLARRRGKIRDFYQRLLPKGKKVALVACARKLLVMIWKMLVHRKPYRDNDLELSRKKISTLSLAARPYPMPFSEERSSRTKEE